jgi:NADH:ubiquinone oxidoreductase subunit 4 (subunit M)
MVGSGTLLLAILANHPSRQERFDFIEIGSHGRSGTHDISSQLKGGVDTPNMRWGSWCTWAHSSGFADKVPLVPFYHTWLPPLYSESADRHNDHCSSRAYVQDGRGTAFSASCFRYFRTR